MKGMKLFILALGVSCLAATVFGQGPFVEDQILRDVEQQRHDAAAEAALEQNLEKSEHVRETMQRPPLPEQKPLGEGLQERLVLVQDRLEMLRGKKSLAVHQGKTVVEIAALDEKIEKLKREVIALQAELGVPTQQ